MKTLKKLMGSVDFGHITFTGGEPFLAEGFMELVFAARMKKKGVTIISNGTIAKSEDYRLLGKMGVSLFEFPLHSANHEIHNRLTGGYNAFECVVESIRILTELKKDFCVICVLTKLNIDNLQSTLEYAEKLGARRFMIARFNIGGRGVENVETLLPSMTELRNAFSTANEFAKTHRMRISSNVCVPACIINPADYPHISISTCGSDMSKRPVTVDFTGNVRMCNHSPVIMGNIYQKSMNEILSSEYAVSWQTSIPVYCADCSLWANCRGGCRAASEQLGLSIEHEDPLIGLINNKQAQATFSAMKY